MIVVWIGCVVSCASSKPETTIMPYGAPKPVGQSALVYALPQTRLYFDVELINTLVKRGPYAEYAGRMLGLQNVPMKDSETWQIRSIRVNDRQEVDSKQLYMVSFVDYPQNIDKMLRFTKEGLLLDVTMSNMVSTHQGSSKNNDDFQFVNTAMRSTTVEKVDTLYKTILTDTAFIRIPVLQRKVMGKTAEEQAREAAQQIFNIRQIRIDMLIGNTDYHPEGAALKLVLQSLDTQESQLLSLFNGAKIERRQTITYPVLPDKASASGELFHFSERSGVVSKNTAGAKAVWYEIGNAAAPASVGTDQQATDIIYYRVPQSVEVSAGIDKNTLVREQVTICQLGNIVSFPLVAPQK